MEKIKITLQIAGRRYPLNVPATDEEIYRRVGKQIEKMIKKFEENYEVEDKQGVLAMCAVQLGVNAEMNLQNHHKTIEETNRKMAYLSQILDGDEGI